MSCGCEKGEDRCHRHHGQGHHGQGHHGHHGEDPSDQGHRAECQCGHAEQGEQSERGGCCRGGGRHGFHRTFRSKAEVIAELESYLAELKAEAEAVEERLKELRQ